MCKAVSKAKGAGYFEKLKYNTHSVFLLTTSFQMCSSLVLTITSIQVSVVTKFAPPPAVCPAESL